MFEGIMAGGNLMSRFSLLDFRKLKQDLTAGSSVSSNPSTNLQCRYTSLLPSCFEPGRATAYGFPLAGGG